jgi:metal-responsive CopG/Arc/MetJ family transcriptional regulator
MKSRSDTQVSIPPALVTELQAAADEEHRPTADVVRDALERYLADWRRGGGLAHDGAIDAARRSPAEALARMRERRRGNILPDGATIRDLMTHGRA